MAKKKCIYFFLVLSAKPEALLVIFILLELVFFSIFFVLCTMGRAIQISLVDKGAIVALRDEGLMHKAISTRLGLHRSTVTKFLQRFAASGAFDVAPCSGRPKNTMAAQDRLLVLLSVFFTCICIIY